MAGLIRVLILVLSGGRPYLILTRPHSFPQPFILKLYSHELSLLLIDADGIILDLLSHGDVRLEHFIYHINTAEHLLGQNILFQRHEVYVRQFLDLFEFVEQKLLKSLILDLASRALHDQL